MMRSLFSGVAGLKTHQTRMDVIGNNIANVNTTAYKSQSMVFSDLLYQTSQAASGANAATGRGGINARQIGLGAKTGGISTTITTQGSAQSTNNPWDIMIEGDAFFIVSDGSQNFFTRDGSFTIDGAGNLVMSTTGFTLMGWQVDPETGEIRSDVVSALRVMNPVNLTAEPEATTLGYMSGIIDATDTDLSSSRGVVRTLKIYDALGYEYTALFSVHATGNGDEFRVQLDDIEDSTGMSLVEKYGLSNINQIADFGGDIVKDKTSKYSADSNASFEPSDGTNPPYFEIKLPMSDILLGYGDNPLLGAAGKDITIVKIGDTTLPGTVANPVPKDTKVTIEGKVTLSSGVLQSEPYNLIYIASEHKYYADDGNGGYKYLDPATVTDTTAGTVSDWEEALKGMDGLENINAGSLKVTLNDDGSVELSFQADCTMGDAAYYDGTSAFTRRMDYTDANKKDILEQIYHLKDGDGKEYTIEYVGPDGSAQITMVETTYGNTMVFDHDTGKFSYIGMRGSNSAMLTFNTSASSLAGELIDLSQFRNIEIDFSTISNLGNGGKCTLEMTNGSIEDSSIGSGRKTGDLIGIEVAQDGKIKASYDNGMTKLLGQIAVAEFANPSGLAKAGNNLYDTTLNSGQFDGVGTDISANGGTMTSGVLEMSNVDLSAEFTTMITTQRGFQANSRIITVSDTLLEELTSLKR